jgi:hypothetical protein
LSGSRFTVGYFALSIFFEIVDESTNASPAMRDSSGLLVDIPACQMAGRFEFVGRYVLFRGY